MRFASRPVQKLKSRTAPPVHRRRFPGARARPHCRAKYAAVPSDLHCRHPIDRGANVAAPAMTWGARPYRSSRTMDLPSSHALNKIFHLFSALLRNPTTITQDLGVCHIRLPQLSVNPLIGVQEINLSPGTSRRPSSRACRDWSEKSVVGLPAHCPYPAQTYSNRTDFSILPNRRDASHNAPAHTESS